jgi:hypothetical protein
MAYPCTGPSATIFRINKSRVPWGRSDFAAVIVYASFFYILNGIKLKIALFLYQIPFDVVQKLKSRKDKEKQ